MILSILYFGAVGLIGIGVAGLLLSNHLFRMVLALVIAEAGANLLLVLAGFRWNGEAPIAQAGLFPSLMVDPVPQAMVLTAIVIGVGIEALAIVLLIRVRQQGGSLSRSRALEQLQSALDREERMNRRRSLDAPRADLGGQE